MSEKGKEAGIAVTAEELARINRFAKKELRAEEVYTFAVKLCDNEVDRDFERFDRAALEKLSELFVGRTGIFDHSWSAGGQTARIYRAEVIEEKTRTTAGDKYCWCKGWAYMLRTEKNAGADRGDRGRHQKRSERRVQRGEAKLFDLREGRGALRARARKILRREAVLRGAQRHHGRL